MDHSLQLKSNAITALLIMTVMFLFTILIYGERYKQI